MWTSTFLLAALATLRVGVDAGAETPAVVELLRLELPGVDTGTTSVDRDLWVELRGDALFLARRGATPERRALERLLDPAARRRVVALLVTEAAGELGYVRTASASRAAPSGAGARAAAPSAESEGSPGAAPRDGALQTSASPARAIDEAAPRSARAPDAAPARAPSSLGEAPSPWALGVLAGVELATGVGAPRPMLRARLARTDLIVEPYLVLVVGGLACCVVAQPGAEARTASSLLGLGVELGLTDLGPLELRWSTEVVAGASWMAARALSYADRAPVEFSVDFAMAVLAGPVVRWPLGPQLSLDLTGGVAVWARRAAIAVPSGYAGADTPLDPGVAWPFVQAGVKVGL